MSQTRSPLECPPPTIKGLTGAATANVVELASPIPTTQDGGLIGPEVAREPGSRDTIMGTSPPTPSPTDADCQATTGGAPCSPDTTEHLNGPNVHPHAETHFRRIHVSLLDPDLGEEAEVCKLWDRKGIFLTFNPYISRRTYSCLFRVCSRKVPHGRTIEKIKGATHYSSILDTWMISDFKQDPQEVTLEDDEGVMSWLLRTAHLSLLPVLVVLRKASS